MARKAVTSPHFSKNTSKRAAPERPTPTRHSKRAKAAIKTYMEPESDDESTEPKRIAEDSEESNASDYQAEDVKDESSESANEEDNASNEEEEEKRVTPKRRPEKRKSLPSRNKDSNEKELWKSGAKLTPGTQVIIKKPKPRDAGDTPYTNDTIHPNTMLFLKDLAANNDRQWLKLHDPDYRAAHNDFVTFLEALSEKVIEADETIPELPVKDIIFRIYRDIRFSKDQTPYKTHFSAAWSRTGRKGPYAAYYVQVMPGGGSFVGGGLWCPEAHALSLLRRDIDQKPHKLKAVLTNADIRKAFLGGIPNDERKAVKAFVNMPQNKSNALKKNPKGYDKHHADIELLRLKNFTLGTRLSDDEVLGARALDRISGLVRAMVPFITHLNSVVMPDEESESESEEPDSEEEAESEGESGAEGSGAGREDSEAAG